MLIPTLSSDNAPDPSPCGGLSELNHRHLSTSISTNSALIADVQNGHLKATKKHLLTAETQSAGRGQHGRSWQSPRGNVYLSLYHPVHVPIGGLLSLIVGVELASIPIIQMLNKRLQAQALAPIGVKWANDLGFYQKEATRTLSDTNDASPFCKLAGILIEPVWQVGTLVGVVIGVGLNVQATPVLTAQTCEGMSYQAISLHDIEQRVAPNTATSLPSLPVLYQQVSEALVTAVARFEHLHIQPATAVGHGLAQFLTQFDSMDALRHQRLRVTQEHHGQTTVLIGHACGIDTHGCLQLRQDNGNILPIFTGRIDVICHTQTTGI